MSEFIWRKSRHSGSGGAGGQECIEVAKLPYAIAVRDSKAPETGHLTLTPRAFAGLLVQVKQHEEDA